MKLARNSLSSLGDLEHLRAVKNLTSVTIEGNPLAGRAHARPFAIFHLPKLDSLDDTAISSAEREAANQRFSAEELSRLRTALHDALGEVDALKERNRVLERSLTAAETAKEQLRADVRAVTAKVPSGVCFGT